MTKACRKSRSVPGRWRFCNGPTLLLLDANECALPTAADTLVCRPPAVSYCFPFPYLSFRILDLSGLRRPNISFRSKLFRPAKLVERAEKSCFHESAWLGRNSVKSVAIGLLLPSVTYVPVLRNSTGSRRVRALPHRAQTRAGVRLRTRMGPAFQRHPSPIQP